MLSGAVRIEADLYSPHVAARNRARQRLSHCKSVRVQNGCQAQLVRVREQRNQIVAQRGFATTQGNDEAPSGAKFAQKRLDLFARELTLQPLDLVAVLTRMVAPIGKQQMQPNRRARARSQREKCVFR